MKLRSPTSLDAKPKRNNNAKAPNLKASTSRLNLDKCVAAGMLIGK